MKNPELPEVMNYPADLELPNNVPTDVKMSVSMVTYNHAPYIGKAIESILMQDTNFSFELCIGEDDSTDGTREICIEYARKFKDKIRLFLRSRNDVLFLDGSPTGVRNGNKTRAACRGKYIAICDGDDYWTDPRKLQRQVDFMEQHEDCSLTFHPAYATYSDEDTRKRIIARHYEVDKWVPARKIIWGGGGFIVTTTMVLRADLLSTDMPKFLMSSPVADLPLQIIMAVRGKVRYLNSPMAVHRENVPGSWSERTRGIEKKILHVSRMLGVLDDILRFLPRHLWAFVYARMMFQAVKSGRAVSVSNTSSTALDVSRVKSRFRRLTLTLAYQLGKASAILGRARRAEV